MLAARTGRTAPRGLIGPAGVAVDSAGNLYVADDYNYTIREVTPVGTNWVVTTLAGLAGNAGSADGTNSAARFNYPAGVAVDSAGNVYVADFYNHTIRKVTPVGTNWVVTTLAGLAGNHGSADGTNSAARFYYPDGVAVDSERQCLCGGLRQQHDPQSDTGRNELGGDDPGRTGGQCWQRGRDE